MFIGHLGAARHNYLTSGVEWAGEERKEGGGSRGNDVTRKAVMWEAMQ